MSTRLQRTGAVAAAVIVGGGAAGMIAGTGNDAVAQYHTPWSRTDAANLGFTGLLEGYEFGHSKWNNNDIQEAWPIEGADCSGYVGKVWAAPVYTDIGTDYGYPDTSTWYANGVDGSIELDRNDGRTRQMDVWVERKAYGGDSNHMGVYEGSQDPNGRWKVWHAASEQYGIRYDHYSTDWFNNNNVKRFKRANW